MLTFISGKSECSQMGVFEMYSQLNTHTSQMISLLLQINITFIYMA